MNLRYFILSAAVCIALPVLGQSVPAADDDTDLEVREHPDIDDDEPEDEIKIPSYLNCGANHIKMNGADWSRVKAAAECCGSQPFTIVHIGDSHIQADISTAVVRDMLQYDYGNAGRGLITPLRLSGTNEPRDYTFNSKQPWNALKLMRGPWNRTMGFTGTSVSPLKKTSEIIVSTRDDDNYNPFSSVTMFHNGIMDVTKVTDADDNEVEFRAIPSKDYTHIELAAETHKVTIYFNSAGDLTLYGANLSGDRPGVFYHTIGNNGATYDTYNRIGTLGPGISPLNPDLIIISLGTNEAFGKTVDRVALYASIDRLVKSVMVSNPDAALLLVTPMECDRSTSKVISKRVKRKGKTQTVRQRTKTYSVNRNILPVRETILKYGADKGIAVYDWYEVAGGTGSASKWQADGLYSKDHVHHTSSGYRLSGRMLYEALKDVL